MNGTITYLDIPKRRISPKALTSRSLILGRKYQLPDNMPATTLHGICGGFIPNLQCGEVLPLQNSASGVYCYLWDNDNELRQTNSTLISTDGEHIAMHSNTPVIGNRFTLSHTSLNKPELSTKDGGQQLTMSAGFEFHYSTDVMDACLGVINLVESHCFAALENGESYSLQDSGEDNRALFLAKEHNTDAIQPIPQIQQDSVTRKHFHEVSVGHMIPEAIDNLTAETMAVETLTVLEQYQTFFMQRELPFTEENIWTPVCAPISWGWSMRIARRYDGEWGIARQKLLMPTLGQNGMEMPSWQASIAAKPLL